LIFSACSIPLIITEFFNESPGLVISPRGITARFFEISWHQVKKVRVIRGFRIPDLLSLELYDRDSNIQIPATLLETSFDETTALIKAYHKKYGRR
jgi:hypothetical protein